jgi:hypothetical protein
VSSITNDVWRETSSEPLNEIVTVCPAIKEHERRTGETAPARPAPGMNDPL